MGYYSRWPAYVSVAERRARAEKKAASLRKKGQKLNPVLCEGKSISSTFWGKSWCKNLETYSDYSNRLPRGRSYVKNGLLIDLQVYPGLVTAQVMGSSLYHVTINITSMSTFAWEQLVAACTGKIDSLVELLQGKFSKNVMQILTNETNGLFPKLHEISMNCSCPDGVCMCKHISAALYGIGACLDSRPEWLFTLRNVNHLDLLESVTQANLPLVEASCPQFLETDQLASVFGITLDEEIVGTIPSIDIETTADVTPKKEQKKRTVSSSKKLTQKTKKTTKSSLKEKDTKKKKIPIKNVSSKHKKNKND